MPNIFFHSELENKDFKLRNKLKLKLWIKNVLKKHNTILKSELNFIFVSEEEILRINQESLNHDYLTDVITFQYNLTEVGGDVYICPSVVEDNAEEFQSDFTDEMHRVLIHAVLHMIGFGDKSLEEEKLMRKMENESLLLRTF